MLGVRESALCPLRFGDRRSACSPTVMSSAPKAMLIAAWRVYLVEKLELGSPTRADRAHHDERRRCASCQDESSCDGSCAGRCRQLQIIAAGSGS
jgi:hypothetical protein